MGQPISQASSETDEFLTEGFDELENFDFGDFDESSSDLLDAVTPAQTPIKNTPLQSLKGSTTSLNTAKKPTESSEAVFDIYGTVDELTEEDSVRTEVVSKPIESSDATASNPFEQIEAFETTADEDEIEAFETTTFEENADSSALDSSPTSHIETDPIDDFILAESDEADSAVFEEVEDWTEPQPTVTPKIDLRQPEPPLVTETPMQPIFLETSIHGKSLGSEVLLNMPHQLQVEVGRTSLTGAEITQLTYGSVIELGRKAGDPVDLVLNNKVVAQGEVVLINQQQLGVRIISIVGENTL